MRLPSTASFLALALVSSLLPALASAQSERLAPRSPWEEYRPAATAQEPAAARAPLAPVAPVALSTPQGPQAAPLFLPLAAPAPLPAPPQAALPPPAAGAARGRIGYVGPLSGPLAAYGLACRRGIELALADAARAGTASLELLVQDDKGEELFSSARTVRLAADPTVLAILGAVNGKAPNASSRIAVSAGCPELRAAPADPAGARTEDRGAFRNLTDDMLQGAALARYLFDQRAFTRVALVHDDTTSGRGGARVFQSEAASRDRKLPLVRELTRSQPSLAPLADELAASGVQAVVFWGAADQGAEFCKALAAKGTRIAVAGSDSLAGTSFLARAGAAAEGAVIAYPADAIRHDAWARTFADRFRREYGQEPDASASAAYSAAEKVVAAVRQAGPDRARVRELLSGLVARPGGVTSATSQAGVPPIQLAIVESGRFRPIGLGR